MIEDEPMYRRFHVKDIVEVIIWLSLLHDEQLINYVTLLNRLIYVVVSV